MIFKKPPKQTPDSLTHPKNKKTWNGSKRRPPSENGFVTAGRVSVTHGTRPPSNVKTVDLPSVDSVNTTQSRDIMGIKPIPKDHRFTPAFERDLTDHQKQMVSPRQRKQHKKKK